MIQQGAHAEFLAIHYLQQDGLKLVEQNYRRRFGEVDLIMQEGASLIFIEVCL
jgi:putative endonuclease